MAEFFDDLAVDEVCHVRDQEQKASESRDETSPHCYNLEQLTDVLMWDTCTPTMLLSRNASLQHENTQTQWECLHWSKVETGIWSSSGLSNPLAHLGSTAVLVVALSGNLFIAVHGVQRTMDAACNSISDTNSRPITNSDELSQKVFLYDVEGSRWLLPQCTGMKPPCRTGHCAVMLPGRKMWTFGGQRRTGNCVGDVFVWSFDTFTWEKLNQSTHKAVQCSSVTVGPQPRHDARAIFSKVSGSSGSIVLFGGRDMAGDALGDLWIWDVFTSTWSKPVLLKSGEPPLPRFG